MKKFILIFLIIFFALTLNAQSTNAKEDRRELISRGEKFRNTVDISEIHSYVMPSYNNDSLYEEFNKDIKSGEIVGVPTDVFIDIRKEGKLIKMDSGNLWLYTIESPTAKGIFVRLNGMILPEGASLGFYPHDIPESLWYPDIYTREDTIYTTRDVGLFTSVLSNRMIIEYYEPYYTFIKPDITIKSIGYGFK